MSNPIFSERLSRRERQIMDVIYRLDQASAADVLANIPDPPSYSSVRALLRILEDKGHLTHIEDGPRYIFAPTRPRQNAARSSIQQVVQTFVGGSVEQAVATMLSSDELEISDEELGRLEALIKHAKDSAAQIKGAGK